MYESEGRLPWGGKRPRKHFFPQRYPDSDDDADDSPAAPESQDSPAAPESQDSPAAPEAQDSPAVPEAQDSPAVPEAQDSHATPEAQDTHVVPEAQDSHATQVNEPVSHFRSLPLSRMEHDMPDFLDLSIFDQNEKVSILCVCVLTLL